MVDKKIKFVLNDGYFVNDTIKRIFKLIFNLDNDNDSVNK